jgi:hypothetical protein
MEGKLIDAIVRAVKIGFPMYFPRKGEVVSVSKPKKTLEVKTDDGILSNVSFCDTIVPEKGSKCTVIPKDNLPNRYVAVGFDKIAEIDLEVGETFKVEIDSTSAILEHASGIDLTMDTFGIEMNIPFGKLVVNGDTEFNGDIEQNGDFETTGSIKADDEVTAKASSPGSSVGLSTHLTPYFDTPAGPAVSDKPQGGS